MRTVSCKTFIYLFHVNKLVLLKVKTGQMIEPEVAFAKFIFIVIIFDSLQKIEDFYGSWLHCLFNIPSVRS